MPGIFKPYASSGKGKISAMGKRVLARLNSKRSMTKKSAIVRKSSSWTDPSLNSNGHLGRQLSTTVLKGYVPFGDRVFMNSSYSFDYGISSSGSSALAFCPEQFSASGPQQCRVGTNPSNSSWFSTFAALYTRYRVMGVKVQCQFTDPTADGGYCGVRVRYLTGDAYTTAGKTIVQLKELLNTEMRPMANTGAQNTNFKFAITPRKIFGVTKEQYSTVGIYDSLTSTIPSTSVIIEPFFINTASAVTATLDIHVNISIQYFIQFYGKLNADY